MRHARRFIWTVVAVWPCVVHAQETRLFHEKFHGSPIRKPTVSDFWAGSKTQRNGSENLYIRTTAKSIQQFIKVKLPDPEKKLFENSSYPFSMLVGSPENINDTCTEMPDSKHEWEICFDTRPLKSKNGKWSAIELSNNPKDYMKIGFRGKFDSDIYANCDYIAPRQFGMCRIYFEQNDIWHEIFTSPQALDDMWLFLCAAVQLRNYVWPNGPSTDDYCRPRPTDSRKKAAMAEGSMFVMA
ncbi:hypothetical protein AB4099_21580 [Bosea sp. 2KB_26]|uniref:hypothetical protein n=1 Tax=Bosea sp. 2KB_26 TaxID=3237475 RepID=UPI003F8ED085